MALPAPQSAYRSFGYWVRKTSDIKHEALILQTSKAVMLARFYLDDILGICGPGNLDGYIGIVYPGTANYAKHAASRLGIAGGGNGGILLLDGGANTLGDAKWGTTDAGTPLTNYANHILCPHYFKSAFYLNSTLIGFQHKRTHESTWRTYGIGTLPGDATRTDNHAIRTYDYVKNDNIQIRPIITNAEGTFLGTIKTVSLINPLAFYLSSRRDLACSATGEVPVDLVIPEDTATFIGSFTATTPQVTGHYLYAGFNSSSGALTRAATGWYSGLAPNSGGQKRWIFVGASGHVSHTQLCTPPTTVTSYVSIVINLKDILDDGAVDTYSVVAGLTDTQSQFTTIAGSVIEYLGSSPMQEIPFSITIPAGSGQVKHALKFSKIYSNSKFKFGTVNALRYGPVTKYDEI